jgi:sulfane dehydrogenase subunit SoxC
LPRPHQEASRRRIPFRHRLDDFSPHILRTRDGGKSWNLASLQDPVLAISQTRFRFPWIWDGKPAVIQSRATDETGYSQPTHQQLIAERGPLETGSLFYHMNAIQSWGIAADGSVKNVHPLG